MKNIVRKTWLLAIVLLFIGASVLPSISAEVNKADEIQTQPQPLMAFWEDNFDSYADGSSLHGQGGWSGWDDVPDGTLVTSGQSLSAPHSVDIVDSSDLVHEYTGITSGQWTYTAMQYIPEDFLGQSYFILLSHYEVPATQDSCKWAVQLRFDSDLEVVESEHGGLSLPLLTGEWIEIRIEIDLDTDWMEIYYDGDLLEEKAWTSTPNNDFTGDLSIGAVDLFAYGSTSVYYDDMSLDGEVTQQDLDCEGDLDWVDVAVGSTVTGSFTVENIGAPGSELNWEISDEPDWGTWTFTPDSGTALTPEDGPVTIEVEVVAPDDKETEFSGSVKIVNTDNSADFCTIDASLVTPMSHSMPFLWQRFLDRHPIIAALFGL